MYSYFDKMIHISTDYAKGSQTFACHTVCISIRMYKYNIKYIHLILYIIYYYMYRIFMNYEFNLYEILL